MKQEENMFTREETRKIKVGNVYIGGDAPICIQSMTNTKTEDVEATVAQIRRLEEAGCEIVRATISNMESAKAIKEIKEKIHIPLVADIHFDYRLALEAVKNGIDKIRINPGNIGDKEKVKEVVEACKEKKIPIRIGVNGGLLEKHILAKYGEPTAEALVESALYHVRILEELEFYDICVSIKSSNVPTVIEAYKLFASKKNYPLHIGVTEAGTLLGGAIKSSVGIGTMLYLGIGNTMRVSLTSDPVDEIHVAKQILKSVGLLKEGVEIISCPTCGRTSINLISLAKEVEKRTKHIKRPLKIAIMGCAVNGPGEAREADIGIAGGKGSGLIFKQGKVLRKVDESEMLNELMKEIENML